MARREIDDQEYHYLQGRRQVADFVESIYNDPKLAREAKALIKKKYPNLQIPDYDIEAKVDARFAAEKQKRDEAVMKYRRSQEDAKIKKDREDTQKKYKFTDDAMKRLENMMVERNIGDYEAGAMLLASKEPTPIDATGDYDSTRYHHERQDDFKAISKDPEAWGRTEIMNAIRRDEQKMKNGG
jgi:hypothetical protein